MEENNDQISFKEISEFLEGNNPEKYLTQIELNQYDKEAVLVFNIPEDMVDSISIPYKTYFWPTKTKLICKDTYKPFIWITEEAGKLINEKCGGKENRINRMKYLGLEIKKLRTHNKKGVEPTKVKNGYKYMLSCTQNGAYVEITQFLKKLGIDIYGETHRKMFMACSPVEQYLIQTKKRLFKGFDDYDNLHKLTFDLETTGLNPKTSETFAIGVKDNRGFEELIEVNNEGGLTEFEATTRFFEIIDILKPDIIHGYYSENFDFNFLEVRAEMLGKDIRWVAKTLSPNKEYRRNPNANLKIGGESEKYTQTIMYGTHVIDTIHAVRRAKAIDSSIETTGLKYVTTFCEFEKENRVYIDGDKIGTLWYDTDRFAFNDTDGSYYKTNSEKELKSGYSIVSGKYIVQRYLMDDLWETQKVDYHFNQANFLINKILPTTYSKVCTMGTSSIWKLILMAWSFENGLAIPQLEAKQDFVGGLARLMTLGYVKDVYKFDFTSLYPTVELAHAIKTDKDITDVMSGMLKYVLDERIRFKDLKKEHGKKKEELEKLLPTITDEKEIERILNEIKYHSEQENQNDKKQLPLKILANSFFGSFGAGYLFPWGDFDCAEETTCRGRQYLRLMIYFFTMKGFTPLVGDTDGFNFKAPNELDMEYTSNGKYFKNKEGKVYKGVDAVLAEFNDLYMKEPMGLSIDEYCTSTINFSKKNYVDLFPPTKKHPNGKMKKVGNTVKSSTISIYQQEFFNDGLRLLCEGKGYEFITSYYDYIDKIYNYQIPLRKIATKANIKQSIDSYKENCTKTNKAGRLNSRQAHMELAIKEDLIVNLGDQLYFYNTGTQKSHANVKFNGKTGELGINCTLLSKSIVENEIDEYGEYNAALYIGNFNKRLESLLICFSPEIRYDILIDNPKKRKEFLRSQCELVYGIPSTKIKTQKHQTSYEEIMTPADDEIRFWLRVNKIPNNDFVLYKPWDDIVEDFKAREVIRIQREKNEDKKFFIEHLIEDKKASNKRHSVKIPKKLEIQYLINEEGFFSRRHNDKVASIMDYSAFYEMELVEWLEYLNKENTTDLYGIYVMMQEASEESIHEEKMKFIRMIVDDPGKTKRAIKKGNFPTGFKKLFVLDESGENIMSIKNKIKIASVEDYLKFFDCEEPGDNWVESNDTNLYELYQEYVDSISEDEDEEVESEEFETDIIKPLSDDFYE